MSKYTIGIDFGSLSGRALLLDITNGREVASSVFEYPHAVMYKELPTGEKLGSEYALQHPQDYLDVLYNTIPEVIKTSGVNPGDITAIGTDFTACTVLPCKADGTPLCFLDEYKHNPHSWVKLWKHHAAQYEANKLNKIAESRGEAWLKNYGGKISSEWEIPKLMQVADEAPEIYNAMDRWIEAADWIVWMMTGKETRNSCTAGYKALWNKRLGYPSKDFFKALNPMLENCAEEKLGKEISPQGERAGSITAEFAKKTGLSPETMVCVGNVDAHVCVPSAAINTTGKMLAIIGTSTCHILMGNEEKQVPGMCGVVEDGVMPGLFGYEAGQSCVGDHFAWLADNCVPEDYYNKAKENGMNIHEYLTSLASKLKVGESGLLAIDWWNGNRSVLVDADLTGCMLGMTLATKPEEMYRALIEATAFGTRMIVDNFKENGVDVNEFYASGGISVKNEMAMQIYSDILNMPVKIVASAQGPALGSAIFAGVAAGSENGGYDSIFEAAERLGSVREKFYRPIKKNAEVYEALYAEYKKLHDYFGRGGNNVMKTLKQIKLKGDK